MTLEELSKQATRNIGQIISQYDDPTQAYTYYDKQRRRAEHLYSLLYESPVKILLRNDTQKYEQVMNGINQIAFKMMINKYEVQK